MEIVQLSMADFYSPCVYAWRRNGEWLYVGKSVNGLGRLGNHQVIGACRVRPHDDLLIFRVAKIDDLAPLEANLIKANRPRYNKLLKPAEPEPDDDSCAHRLVSRSLLQWVSP